jgi:diguanylate cyclase (GGDEF)-like protein/PAS domain S-box-containing protein
MRTYSIRTHLLVLVLAITVPFLGFVAFVIYSDMQQGVAQTKRLLRVVANTMASNTGRRIANARRLVELLAARPLVRRVDSNNCDGILKEFLTLYPMYANVGYVDRDGNVVCSAIAPPHGEVFSAKNATWFQNVRSLKRFNVAPPFTGKITGKVVSVISTPIWNEHDEMVGAVFLPIDLKTYDPNIPVQLLPSGSHYGFVNEDGIEIWRNVDLNHSIGTRSSTDAAGRIARVRMGEFESVSSDGIRRFYSMNAMPDVGWVAWVGVPASTVYAAAQKRAMIYTSTALIVVLVLVSVAIRISRRIARPVAGLEKAVDAIKGGDFKTRTAEAGPREIASLAHEFNSMVAAEQLNCAQLRIAATAFEAQEGIMVTDAKGVILRVNRAFTDMTGYSAEEAVGQTPSFLKSGRHDADFYRAMWDTIDRTGGWQGEVWDQRKNGDIYPKWLTISAVKDEKGAVTNYVGTHFDISERKQAEEKIYSLAYFDPLTGLANRTLLLDRLRQATTVSRRSHLFGALLFIDLDNFKIVNETQGYDVGDKLLQLVAQRLTKCVREGDTVARVGGDEFVVMLTGLAKIKQEAASTTEQIADKILDSLSQPCPLGIIRHRCTGSIGVTLFLDESTNVDELLKQAELSLYKSKDAGRNAWHFFDPTMEAAVRERVDLEERLRRAVEENQLELHYQAQLENGSRLVGVEALVRWRHPQRGLVSPAEFIPLAETTGLILPLGRWVLETACRQLAEWAQNPSLASLNIAVNVCARQFHHAEFVDQVLDTIKRTGANPLRLKLELTESLLVENVEEIIVKMSELKSKGVGFSLDDFGTGYSSLYYLKRLPLDNLKIDQSFIRDVLINPNDAAIARTIIALAQNLGLGVVAEGVETKAQWDFLADSGCDVYQGYLFSRPLPKHEFEQYAQNFTPL